MLGNFHMLELYSTNQIPVTLIRLCSIMCDFLVNNQHLITFSNHIVQPTEKYSLNAADSKFSTQ